MNDEHKELRALLNQEESNLTAYGQKRIEDLKCELDDSPEWPDELMRRYPS